MQTKRIYEEASNNNGYRVLSTASGPAASPKKKLNKWLKEITPAEELRKWFDHDPDEFKEFKKRYKKESVKWSNYF